MLLCGDVAAVSRAVVAIWQAAKSKPIRRITERLKQIRRRDYLSTGHTAGRGTAAGPMGEAVDKSFSYMAPADIRALVTYVRSVPAMASPDLPASLAPPASSSPKEGGAAETVGKRVFEGACVHCHDWTGVSQISPFATIAGTRGVNDRTATNVVQIVICRHVARDPGRHHIDAFLRQRLFGHGNRGRC